MGGVLVLVSGAIVDLEVCGVIDVFEARVFMMETAMKMKKMHACTLIERAGGRRVERE